MSKSKASESAPTPTYDEFVFSIAHQTANPWVREAWLRVRALVEAEMPDSVAAYRRAEQ